MNLRHYLLKVWKTTGVSPRSSISKGTAGYVFEQIQSQMHSLEQLIGSSLSGSDSRQFEQNAHDIQSNIQFMKELNETFTYLQLPIKLPSQTAGSELYVYTQKKNGRQIRKRCVYCSIWIWNILEN